MTGFLIQIGQLNIKINMYNQNYFTDKDLEILKKSLSSEYFKKLTGVLEELNDFKETENKIKNHYKDDKKDPAKFLNKTLRFIHPCGSETWFKVIAVTDDKMLKVMENGGCGM